MSGCRVEPGPTKEAIPKCVVFLLSHPREEPEPRRVEVGGWRELEKVKLNSF